ncbi:sensor histidine kinase [Actinomycetota bacterium Odt1-20B]
MARRRGRAGRAERPYRRLPLRKSLLGRFLAVSALVAACSVAATAWLAVQTTSGAIRQEQGQNLADDARIYDTLLGYAAEHRQWDGVEKTVRDLADQYGRRIAVTTQAPDRRTIADSATGDSPPALPTRHSAVVDPLTVDTLLGSGGTPATGSTATTDRIDPRAVGPFRLPAKERAKLRALAERNAECLRQMGIPADVEVNSAGRPRVTETASGRVDNDAETAKCSAATVPTPAPQAPGTRAPDEKAPSEKVPSFLDEPTKTETKALKALTKLTDACLRRQGRDPVKLGLDMTKTGPAPTAYDDNADETVATCVNSSRQEQLRSYVAGPALLFIGDPDRASVPGFDLSPANTAKIAGVAALVLALTFGVSVLTGSRLVRPLRALTGAAQRLKDGDRSDPVPVSADNEIGQLAAAFNDMAAHRTRLEELRKAMVSDVAHELRTPLSNIRGWLEAAQDGLADPDPAFVSSLLEEAVQLQHIIDDLQDLAQADADALRLHPEPVRVTELLTQVAAAHQVRADAADVELKVTAPGGPPVALTADPVRLRQAVGNLVSNAVRHTPEGGTVELRAYAEQLADGWESGLVVVEVADSGSGIPAADLPHVFDRFWRAEKSRNRRTGGSGLGLAIVRKLAEAHGGSASAVSTEGEGSVFTLRLPAQGPGGGPDVRTTAS